MRQHDPHRSLDEAIAAVAGETPDPEVERRAAARVLERLRREAPAAAAGATLPQRIRSCDDVQALIPAHLAGELPPSRALLVADHVRECVPCRKALKAAREGGAPASDEAREGAGASDRRRWGSLAAALLLAAGAAFALYHLDFGGDIARVQAVEGTLFRVADARAAALAPGDLIAEGEALRTARGAGAVVHLDDGSRVELRERTEIALTDRRGETTVRVARGGIIVEAAPQRDGRLYVATDDCLVSVTGTIFSVNHGTKGSRVGVIEGEVRVAQGRQETVLHPGQLLATHPGVVAVSLDQEIAWSRDGDRYIALLRELQALDEEVHRALARSGLRHESRLLGLAPPDTAVYLAMPNVASEVAEIYRLFEERLSENETLARWWNERAGDSGLEDLLEELVTRFAALGEHLGEEIAVAVDFDSDGEPESPLLLAEVADPAAFAAVLADEVERLNAIGEGPRLVIVSDPTEPPPADGEALFLWLAGDLFAAAPEPARLAELGGVIGDPGANPFTSTRLYSRLAEAYTHGAQWLGGIAVGSILAGEVDDDGALDFTGLSGVDVLIVEREATAEAVHNAAVLSFAEQRQGALAWLAEPAPMGSLDYVSADASFAAAFAVTEPTAILEEVFRFVESTDPDFREQLDRFEAEHGVRIVDDLAGPLGGEVALALDGPALPEPAWKVVAEVYDPVRFQGAVEWAVAEYNRQAAAAGQPTMELTGEQGSGRTYYRVTFPQAGKEVHYTFHGGYWIAAPSRALLDRALEVEASRYGLTDAPAFTELLPRDGYLNFSAVVFSHLGPLADSLLGMAEGLDLTDEQRQALSELDLGSPTLTCAYGETDRIRLVSTGRGGLFGSRLGTLLGLGALAGGGPPGAGLHGAPLPPGIDL